MSKTISEYSGQWTYRYTKSGKNGEKHYATEEIALHAAIQDVQGGKCDPVCIRAGKHIVYDDQDIYDAWGKKHL